MSDDLKRQIFRAIAKKRFGPPSMWEVKGRPKGWHLDRECTPQDASMHDNGVNDALMAINEMMLSGE